MSTVAALTLSSRDSVLDRVRALLPEIDSRVDEIEAGCAVPKDLLKKVEETGAFRMCLPKSYGGEQLQQGEVARVIEAIAEVDASVAWHLMVTVGSQVITSRLPAATLEQFYAGGPDTWPKVSFAPKAVAEPVAGGYRLSGRWPLASGNRDFDYVGLGFLVKDGRGILKSADGKLPDMRICIVPKEGVTVIKTWDAVGLRGTCSDDLEVKDMFVPDAWQASLFGKSNLDAPIVGTSMPFATGPQHSAVALGILRGAIKVLATEALTRKPAFNPLVVMKDDATFRSRFGELATRVDALDALADRCIEVLEQCEREHRDPAPLEGARLTAAVSLIHHDGTRVMDDIMSLSGSGALYMSNRQQRRWRDMRCVAQHQAANISSHGLYAAALCEAAAVEH